MLASASSSGFDYFDGGGISLPHPDVYRRGFHFFDHLAAGHAAALERKTAFTYLPKEPQDPTAPLDSERNRIYLHRHRAVSGDRFAVDGRCLGGISFDGNSFWAALEYWSLL